MCGSPLWIFGYGSLIWQPGFVFVERRIARLPGYRRGFFMRSIHYRGNVRKPGLVLALDASAGAVCAGVAFRIAADEAPGALAYLRARELISSAYLERRLPVVLAEGREVEAICYVVDREHDQYCGAIAREEQARIIAGAIGGRGPNCDYLWQTAEHLVQLGLEDSELMWLSGRVRQILQG